MNLKINHRLGVDKVDFFNSFELDLKYDSLASTFAFNYYFNPKNKKHAELSCVSHFHEAIVEHNGAVLVNGFILSQVFNSGPAKQLVKIGGYSKPGVLEDCNIPPEIFPLQSDGLSIKEIAEKLIKPFKLKMVIDSSVASVMNEKITKSTSEATQTIKDYLTEITAQRDIVITHNSNGDILFTKAKTDLKPIAHFEKGVIGTEYSLAFNGQAIHSQITVVKEASAEGGNAGEYTIKNPLCPIVFRPRTIVQSSGTDNTVQDAAKIALSAELKNIVLTIKTDRWDINGQIILPNNLITITDREIFLYNKCKWFIESVKYKGNEKEMTAELTCVLPEVHNKNTPVNIFVDPHENLPRF